MIKSGETSVSSLSSEKLVIGRGSFFSLVGKWSMIGFEPIRNGIFVTGELSKTGRG
jgi:hypothetical protein